MKWREKLQTNLLFMRFFFLRIIMVKISHIVKSLTLVCADSYHANASDTKKEAAFHERYSHQCHATA